MIIEALYFSSIFLAFSVLLLFAEHWNLISVNSNSKNNNNKTKDTILYFIQGMTIIGTVALLTIKINYFSNTIIYLASFVYLMWIYSFWILRKFSIGGKALSISYMLLFISGTIWAFYFIDHAPFSQKTEVLLYLSLGLGLLMIPIQFKNLILKVSILGRKDWTRQPLQSQLQHWTRNKELLNPAAKEQFELKPNNIGKKMSFFPKITVQVPCYCEPPEVVIATLNSLSRLEYPNFEVLVIDNNTPDESIWKPAEEYCKVLGKRFRFFHVAPLKGAKAGALNWAHQHIHPNSKFLAVIDADYQVEPDFLNRLIPLFDDWNIGFVQSSHDYRDHQSNTFKEACYWEYMPAYKLMIPSLNEWNAGYTVGTMCILRRETYERIGGWSEWCLTEDAELAVRVHALGYKSLVVPDTFGRGMIPENFAEYKKQRFRWTAGPIQQLKHHFKMLLPASIAKSSMLSKRQKFFELVHGGAFAPLLLKLISFPLAMITFESISVGNQNVEVPEVAIFALLIHLLASFGTFWLTGRLIGANFKQMILGQVARYSLSHIQEIATFKGFFQSQGMKWRRTSKFAENAHLWNAIMDTQWEILRFIGWFCAAIVLIFYSGGKSLLIIGGLASLANSIPYFCSIVMALLAEYNLNEKPLPETSSAVYEL